MKKIYIMFLISLSNLNCIAQNLVPNPSFEIYDTCPLETGHLNYASHWFKPTNGTPDYFNSCFDSSMQYGNVMDVPFNLLGYQAAKTDSAYAGIITFEYSSNIREYIEAKLDSQLVGGVTYFVRFYVSRSDSCIWATDRMGAFFSVDTALGTTWYPLQVTPQIQNPNGNIISDPTNWVLISGSFIAQGGERFITIGNFYNDINSDTMTVIGGNPLYSGNRMAYYYLDDVCVSSDSMDCLNFAIGYAGTSKENLLIYPNPVTDLLFIELDNPQNAIVYVFNCIGEEIFSKTFNCKKTTIDLSILENGIYMIKIQLRDQIFSRKIILNKT